MTTKATNNSVVTVHYTGTLEDGTVFDSSLQREPFSFQLGTGQVIPGFNDGIIEMEVGETKTIVIPPENAYGPVNPNAFQTVPKTNFPEGMEFIVDGALQGTREDGSPFVARISQVNDRDIIVDLNHTLAGKTLSFEVELLSVA